MPRYRFQWSNLPEGLLTELADWFDLEGSSADVLRAEFGARPGEDFVRWAWPVLRDSWLAGDEESRSTVVAALRSRHVGDEEIEVADAAGQLAYLGSVRNTRGLRDVVLERFISIGELADATPVGIEPDTDVSPDPRADDAWRQLGDRLAHVLSVLSDDQFLLLTTKEGSYYVQFAAEGPFGMRAEAVSNSFLSKGAQLDAGQQAQLVEMGWSPPTYTPADDVVGRDGSVNYFVDVDAPVPSDQLADLAVRTLRDVYQVVHPGLMQYRSFADDGAAILLPTLGLALEGTADASPGEPPAPTDLPVPQSTQELRSLVLAALQEVFTIELEWGDDPWMPITWGTTVVHIGVDDEAPVIRMWALLVADVPPRADVVKLLNEHNERLTFIRLVQSGDLVVAVADVLGSPFVASHVQALFKNLADAADDLDEELQEAIGGRTAFGVAAPSDGRTFGYL